MEKYFKRKSTDELTESSSAPKKVHSSSKEASLGINLEDLPTDPGLRTRIWSYGFNVREKVRMAYIQKGPCQPRDYKFPKKTLAGNSERRFNPAWFDEFSTWLEYSIEKDAAFCLCCYLFKPENGEQAGGDAFTSKGFSNWKRGKEALQGHVGGPNSSHNKAWGSYEALLKQNQARNDCQTLLGASIDSIKFLMRQGLLFCRHDQYEASNYQGRIVGLLRFLCDHSTDIKAAALRNSQNLKLTSCDIQKDIVSAISTEVINTITTDISDSLFSVLINDFLDMSSTNQMAIVLRFVDKGSVIERFLGIVHVPNATAFSIKVALDDFFSSHGIIMSKLRGLTYVGTRSMHCEFNSLMMLKMKENNAVYVHSFAHDLHSVLIDVVKNHKELMGLFTGVANVVSVVGTFVQCHDTLQKKHGVSVLEALNTGELIREQGVNETSSKFKILSSLLTVFSSVINVLEIIAELGSDSEQKYKADILLDSLQSFSFIFCSHMLVRILGITNDLSQALQRKDQDILDFLNLVQVCREKLKMMRESYWDSLIDEVSNFCDKHHIEVQNMDGMYLVAQGGPRHKAQVITKKHHYCVELFYNVIDMQLQELNNQFTEMNTLLLLCVACLDPGNSFSAFDKLKLIQLARYYPNDFSASDFMILEDQLDKYILDMRSSIEFSTLRGISDLAEKLVETGKDQVYPLVYLLLTLALILPVVTPRVERLFSAVNLLKNQSPNQMEDQWIKDSLIGYVEIDILDSIDNKVILQRLQHVKKFPWKL